MPKQTLVFESPVQLSVQNSMLKIAYKDDPDNVTLRAIEDIAIILIDNHSASLTTPLIGKLAEQNVAVVFCNEKHMPSSMLMNLDANTLQEKYFRLQLDAPLPLKKQMWKNVVEAKIKNQALHLKSLGKKHDKLLKYATGVLSGDSSNREGLAAQYYWRELFGKEFIRDRFGEHPNDFLNYGYTLLRAATARALMASGLLPSLGIFHRNYYDAFPLADDIMEPYRPFIDQIAYKLHATTKKKLDKEVKTSFLELFYTNIPFGEQMVQLGTCLTYTTASVAKFFMGETKNIAYPRVSCGS